MTLNRRSFLAATSAAIVSSSIPIPRIFAMANQLAGRNRDGRILVVIQLSGGNDGLNTVVPFGDDAYHRNRFATRIETPSILKIDDYLGWHPSLRGFANLQQAGKLCAIQGVGYPNPNRSHFESMDIWHSARLAPPHRTGWLGRWCDDKDERGGSASIPGVHLGDEPMPLAMTGLHAMIPSLKSIESLRLADDESVRMALAATEPAGESKDELLEYLRQARQTALTASKRLEMLGGVDDIPSHYPRTELARELAFVAKLIAIDFGSSVYYVTLGSFDTHSQQAAAHAALLSELGGAVEAFCQDVGLQGRSEDVLLVCFSEFGRRVKENGSAGTDHGTAAPVFVAGKNLLPTLGSHPSMTELVDGDLLFQIDFRSVYATLLEQWLSVDSVEILGEKFQTLSLLS